MCSLCFTENSLPKPKLPEDSVISPYNINPSYPGLATGNGLSDSPAGSKDHGNVPIIVPLIPPPFIKPPAGKSWWTFKNDYYHWHVLRLLYHDVLVMDLISKCLKTVAGNFKTEWESDFICWYSWKTSANAATTDLCCLWLSARWIILSALQKHLLFRKKKDFVLMHEGFK